MTSFLAMKSGDILGGKYKLMHELGKGATGAVWAAHGLESSRDVAVKFILPRQKAPLTNTLRQRLMQEARACGKVCHPNLVQIHDVAETTDGEPFLVLELLHGQTVAQLLDQKGQIEPAMAARIVAEAASGLVAAHSAHLIHRDLKPANLYLHRESGSSEKDFVLKILDFGVCKNLDNVDHLMTQSRTAVGTPVYLSPEQVAMRNDLDQRTDIWSLGIVLYELLTGARPFSGTAAEVARQIVLTPVPPPSETVRDVSPELDLVVAMCTAQNREKRYASAQQLANALYTISGARPQVSRNGMPRKTASMIKSKALPAAIRVPSSVPRPASSPKQKVERSNEALSLPEALPGAAVIKPVNSSPAVDDAHMVPTIPLSKPVLSDALQAPAEPSHSVNAADGVRLDESADAHQSSVTPKVRPGASAGEVTAGTTMSLPSPVHKAIPRRRKDKMLFGAVGFAVFAALIIILGVVWKTYQDKPREQAMVDVPPLKYDSVASGARVLPEVVEPPRNPPLPEIAIEDNGPSPPPVPGADVVGTRKRAESGKPTYLQRPAIKSPGGISKPLKARCKQRNVFQKCTS